MAKLVAQPDVLEFWDYVLLQHVKDVCIETIVCRKNSKDPEKSTLKDLNLRKISGGANIIGVKTQDGNFIFNPSPDFALKSGDMLFALGSSDQIQSLRNILEK